MGAQEKPLVSTAEQYNQLRKNLEKGLVPPSPLAYSTDGKTFGYETPLSLPLSVGCYVSLNSEDGSTYLGQVITQEIAVKDGPEFGVSTTADLSVLITRSTTSSNYVDRILIRYIQGVGEILGRSDAGTLVTTTDEDTFQDAEISKASHQLVNQYLSFVRGTQAVLEIGRALYVNGQSRVYLKSKGFKRHTFLCGQSGSGKTFALGVILEQILLETGLRVVILDPNSDFTSLDKVRRITDVNKTRSQELSPRNYDEIIDRYDKVKSSLRIIRPADYVTNSSNTLRIRFSDLERDEQATILQMHPLQDREEFNGFRKLIENLKQKNYSLSDIMTSIAHDYSAEARQVGLRIENMGIADWEIWSQANELSLIDLLEQDWKCMVIDIGTLSSPSQKSAIAMAVLSHFWQNRNQKKPVLIIIDEAHNICPQQPSNDLEAITTDHLIRFAGEGRKFGLHLLLATQRPTKIHSNVLSQCDNLILMRMNSRSDLTYIAETFSQVHISLLKQSSTFDQGESLLTGEIVQSPTFVKFEGRFSQEGGSDVPSSWAELKKKSSSSAKEE